MPNLMKIFTMEEAAQHNKLDDCWLVIDGKVYDVTSYMDEHPGGDDVLLGATGKDATDDFEDAGHSESAKELMQKYCIGEFDASSAPKVPEFRIYKKEEKNEYVKKIMELTKFWAVPVVVIGISVVIGVIYSHKN